MACFVQWQGWQKRIGIPLPTVFAGQPFKRTSQLVDNSTNMTADGPVLQIYPYRWPM